jgi:hypothetical protein
MVVNSSKSNALAGAILHQTSHHFHREPALLVIDTGARPGLTVLADELAVPLDLNTPVCRMDIVPEA